MKMQIPFSLFAILRELQPIEFILIFIYLSLRLRTLKARLTCAANHICDDKTNDKYDNMSSAYLQPS